MMQNKKEICLYILIFCSYQIYASFLQFKEGDQCDTKTTIKTCRNIKKCPLEADMVKKGLKLDVCGLKQSNLVCCDKKLSKTYYNKSEEFIKEEKTGRKIIKRATAVPGDKSKKMCEKYAEAVYSYVDPPILLDGVQKIKRDNCGVQESPLIVGGEKARAKEFPHMALIGHSETDEIFWQCGGSLISERWIVSAAHCTATRKGLAKWAIIGDLKVLSDEDKDFTDPQTIKIVERKNHPQYEPTKGYHDIALYKLEKDVEFNAFIRPICLNTDTKAYTGKSIATGWGHTRWRGVATNDLMKVVLNLYDMNACNSLYRKSTNPKLLAKIPQGITSDNMVCAWEKGKDTCQGDSGGPLQIKLATPYCMYSIVGVTSFGDECATDLPGVYTRISYYVPWIESLVWP